MYALNTVERLMKILETTDVHYDNGHYYIHTTAQTTELKVNQLSKAKMQIKSIMNAGDGRIELKLQRMGNLTEPQKKANRKARAKNVSLTFNPETDVFHVYEKDNKTVKYVGCLGEGDTRCSCPSFEHGILGDHNFECKHMIAAREEQSSWENCMCLNCNNYTLMEQDCDMRYCNTCDTYYSDVDYNASNMALMEFYMMAYNSSEYDTISEDVEGVKANG